MIDCYKNLEDLLESMEPMNKKLWGNKEDIKRRQVKKPTEQSGREQGSKKQDKTRQDKVRKTTRRAKEQKS